jgi:5-methylcytosine-specific restriction endonuclease McrA
MALSLRLRRACFERDGWKCVHCGNRAGLHPHHIIFKSQGGTDTLDNLMTVDWICHRAIHDGFLKVVQDETVTHGKWIFIRLRGWKP